MDTGNQFLGTERIGKLMRQYAVPCIISLLVGALYNIVDQIFIANATYLGSYGNAANTVVFPLTVIALGIAVMIGDGTCAFVSISLGANKREDAHKSVGNAILLFAGLSYLGLGSPPPTPEWGLMVSEGSDYFQHWWMASFPGLGILTMSMGANFIGDGVRDFLDPKLRKEL